MLCHNVNRNSCVCFGSEIKTVSMRLLTVSANWMRVAIF